MELSCGICAGPLSCVPSWAHTLSPSSFPTHLSPMCFPASHCGSFGLCTDTNKRNGFIFDLHIHPFHSHAHSARSCPDKWGAPGVEGVCQQPRAAAEGEEGHPGFLLCPSAQSPGDPATGKGLGGRPWGGCGCLGQNKHPVHPSCVYLGENQHGMGCC